MKARAIVAGVAFAALSACNADQERAATVETPGDTVGVAGAPAAAAGVQQARAVMRNAQRQEIGVANLRQEGNAVRVDVELTSLPPGELGFHFHQVGACDPPTFESAGGHFNPTDRSHGFDHPEGPHAGDLRNLQVGADGTARASFTNDMVTLAPDQPNSLLDSDGTAVVVHAQPDDYRSQPAGNAGDRIACGIIEPV
jgi:superoxide dismutase, Cu-Zn family